MKLLSRFKIPGLSLLMTTLILGLSVNISYAFSFQKSLYPKEVKLGDVEKNPDYNKKFNVVKIINNNSGKAKRPYLYEVYVLLPEDAKVKTTGAYEEKIPLGKKSIREVVDEYNSTIKAYNYNPGATISTIELENNLIAYIFHGSKVDRIDIWQSEKRITIDIEYERSLSGDEVEA